MMVEVCVTSHHFQHRLCWMMSSMLQQTGDRPELVMNAADMDGTGDPTTKVALDYFASHGLHVKYTDYPDTSILQYRGWVRNRMLTESMADWIIFSDADMVFPPDWFSKLAPYLMRYSRETRMLYTGRYSTPRAQTNNLVAANGPYPRLVPDVWRKVNTVHLKKRRNIGAGFCQIVNAQNIRRKYKLYVNPKIRRDRSWKKGQKATSDMHFRRKVGKLRIDLPYLIHLNHIRDNDMGQHIEDQR